MSDSTRNNVLKEINANRDKAIKFLQDMIAIPSVTGDEAKIQEFLSNTPTIQTRARIEGKIERKFTPSFTGLYRFYRY